MQNSLIKDQNYFIDKAIEGFETLESTLILEHLNESPWKILSTFEKKKFLKNIDKFFSSRFNNKSCEIKFRKRFRKRIKYSKIDNTIYILHDKNINNLPYVLFHYFYAKRKQYQMLSIMKSKDMKNYVEQETLDLWEENYKYIATINSVLNSLNIKRDQIIEKEKIKILHYYQPIELDASLVAIKLVEKMQDDIYTFNEKEYNFFNKIIRDEFYRLLNEESFEKNSENIKNILKQMRLKDKKTQKQI